MGICFCSSVSICSSIPARYAFRPQKIFLYYSGNVYDDFLNGNFCIYPRVTDTCAYFTGLAIGKHKLAPSVSPKKTIEGSIGGVVGVTVILAAYAAVFGNIMDSITANVSAAVCIGLICGVISQFGDLCASVIKRENNIKDFGKIMPGHGGVMDRFDSFIFVAPVVYYFLNSFPIFI